MLADDIGRYQLGQELPLVLQCTIGDVPDTPLRHPTAELRNYAGSRVYLLTLSADEQAQIDGFFRLAVMLDTRFATGRWTTTFRWKDSASRERLMVQTFDIIGGGSADGAIIAMAAVERPQARFLVMQTDGGLLKRGKDPR